MTTIDLRSKHRAHVAETSFHEFFVEAVPELLQEHGYQVTKEPAAEG